MRRDAPLKVGLRSCWCGATVVLGNPGEASVPSRAYLQDLVQRPSAGNGVEATIVHEGEIVRQPVPRAPDWYNRRRRR